MPKKQIRKKKFINVFIVLSVVILFICASIVAIIITEGGKITREGIVETGSIRISIQPNNRNTLVYLNDKQVKPESNVINNVVPGTHTLRIESPQFHIWERTIFIRASLVSDIDVRLFPLESQLNQITKTNIDKLFFSQEGNYVYYTVIDPLLSPSELGLWRLRLDEQEIFFRRSFSPEKLISSDNIAFQYLTQENITLIPDTNNTKLIIINGEFESIGIIDTSQSNQSQSYTPISEKIGFKPNNVWWFNNNNSLILANDEIIIELNLVNDEKTIISYTPDSKPIYSVSGSTIYVYSATEKILYNYQNKILRDVKTPILPDMDIQNIKLSENGKTILFLTTENYVQVDLDFQKIMYIPNTGQIIDYSYDGSSLIIKENDIIVVINIERIVSTKELVLNRFETEIRPDTHPHFIHNSNLIGFNDEINMQLKVSEYDGTNIINVVEKTQVENGYYAFQRYGSSVVLLVEDANEDNVLNKNLFKMNLGSSILPFNL